MSRAGFINTVKGILTVKDTPHRIAVTFAAGVFIGMSPLLGAHILLGFAAAWAFRLNKFIILTGVHVTNPWSMVPIYTFSTWVGMKLLGINMVVPEVDWRADGIFGALKDLKYLLMPFVVGSIIVGLVSAVLGYVIVKRMAERVGRNLG